MKKNLVKILSVVFSITFIFLGILNVKALEITVDDTKSGTTDVNSVLITNKGTITVKDVADNDLLSAFKILDVYYNASSNIITYEFTSEFKAFLASTTGKIHDYSNLKVDDYYALSNNTSEFEALAIEFAVYVNSNSDNINGISMNIVNRVATLETEAGAYLILPTTAFNVYSVMVANLDFYAEGSSWQLNSATVVAKASPPSLIASVNNENYASTSVQKGDIFHYILRTVVPTYPVNALNTSYYMTAIIPETISLTGLSDIVVKVDDDELKTNADGSVTKDGIEVAKLVFTPSGDGNVNSIIIINFDLSKIKSTNVEVIIPVILNNKAYYDGYLGKPHITTFKLNYFKDPFSREESVDGPHNVFVYTYGVDITLINADGVKLRDGSFSICEDVACKKNIVSGLTTDENGFIKFAGLKDATYYVRQDSAPIGYRLMNVVEPIRVGPVATGVEIEEDGYYSMIFTNVVSSMLPSTGGVGTLVFVVIGILIIGVGFYFVIVYRRNNEET